MYSGFSLTKFSGRVMGAHQQIDRLARRHVDDFLIGSNSFPSIRNILRFEGKNGPDGIKIKSPAHNEPWHYLNPLESNNKEYEVILENHFSMLVKSLKGNNQERAAFEAAWLAHAIVDGLTPAHHFPYEAMIEKLRAGKGKESRTTYKEKLVFKGDTISQTIGNMYKVYGPRGLFTAHHLFEFGVMVLLRPLRLADIKLTQDDIKEINTIGLQKYFAHSAREVAVLDLYKDYLDNGWTTRLTNKIRHQLAPIIVKTVATVWVLAALKAGYAHHKR
jgi:hypothetical protein